MQCAAQALNLHLSYKKCNKRFDLMFDYLCVPCVQIKSKNFRRRNSEAGEKKVEGKEEALLWVFALFPQALGGGVWMASHQAVPLGVTIPTSFWRQPLGAGCSRESTTSTIISYLYILGRSSDFLISSLVETP